MSIEYALLDLNAIYGDEAQRQADIEAMELEGTEPDALAELEDVDLRSTVRLHSCYSGHCLPVDDRVPSADPEAHQGCTCATHGDDAVPREERVHEMSSGCWCHPVTEYVPPLPADGQPPCQHTDCYCGTEGCTAWEPETGGEGG